MAKRTSRSEITREIYSELFPPTPSKSDKRRKEIIEGAIQAYAAIDYEHLSFDDIAKPAKTSRRLVQHYFPEKNELFAISMKMVRSQYQALVIEAFSKIEDPEKKFCEYVRAAVSWPKFLPTHVHAWFLYYLVCAQQPKLRKLHEELAKMGEERIASLISEMNPDRAYSANDRRFVAKTIQRLITGALIEICSESINPDIERIQDETVRASLLVIGGPKR